MSDKIEPCPFCGSEAEVDEELGSILCSGCGFAYDMNGPAKEAIEAWNKRPSFPSILGKPVSEAVKIGCEGLLGPTVKIFAMELQRRAAPKVEEKAWKKCPSCGEMPLESEPQCSRCDGRGVIPPDAPVISEVEKAKADVIEAVGLVDLEYAASLFRHDRKSEEGALIVRLIQALDRLAAAEAKEK